MLTLRFTESDLDRAASEWGCNCGPSALAAAMSATLDQVRTLIPGFEQKGFTSPTMMKQAIIAAGLGHTCIADWPERGLVRIQFTGPWTATGANPRWAYRHTHWVASFRVSGGLFVFDCNCGLQTFESWSRDTVPVIARSIPRADGGWFTTHHWQLHRAAAATGGASQSRKFQAE